jgi:hypothetical protein
MPPKVADGNFEIVPKHFPTPIYSVLDKERQSFDDLPTIP